jgi:hypothetical protein
MDKGYVINQLTGNSCAFDKSIMDKCYDGEMIGSKCVTNADEAACLKAGKTWKNNECISGDTPSSGSGCGNIAGSSVPESVSSIMPYLLLLAGLACRRKGRNV